MWTVQLERGLAVKLLFISENYHPMTSGVSVVVRYLAEALDARGHSVTVATSRPGNTADKEKIGGVEIRRFDVRYDLLKRPAGDVEGMRSFVLDGEFEAVVFECSQCPTTDIFLPLLKVIQGSTVFHSHGFSGLTLRPFKRCEMLKHAFGNTRNWLIWKVYYRTFFRRHVTDFDRVMCLSEVDSSMQYLKKHARTAPEVLSNAADDMFFQETSGGALEKYIGYQPERYMVSVANYSEVKNQLGLLRQFSLIRDHQAELVFVGSEKNAYFDALMEAKDGLDPSIRKRVHILTGVAREDIPSIDAGAEIYLVGSSIEVFSISVIEAMAQGTPFISTDVGNARVLPGGITLKSIEMMHLEIDALLNDPNRQRSLGRDAKAYAFETCRISQAAGKLEKIILEALAEKNEGRTPHDRFKASRRLGKPDV